MSKRFTRKKYFQLVSSMEFEVIEPAGKDNIFFLNLRDLSNLELSELVFLCAIFCIHCCYNVDQNKGFKFLKVYLTIYRK